MADHQFEQKVSQQLADFKLKPNAEVWQQVEKQLEEDRRRRRWFFYLPIAALFIGGLLYAVWPEEKSAKADVAAQSDTNNTTTITTTVETNTNKSPLTKTGSSSTTNANEAAASEKEVNENNLHAQTKITQPIQQNSNVTKPNQQKVKTTTTTEIAASAQKQATEDKVVADKITVQKETSAENAVVVVDTKQPEEKNDTVLINQSIVTKSDSAQTNESTIVADSISNKSSEQTPILSKKKWQLGVSISAGTSDIRGSLFPGSGTKSLYFSDAYAPAGNNTGGQGGVTRIVQYEYTVRPFLQMGAGIMLRKSFKKRHSFVTGLQYQYSSYSVTQRQRIDTFIAVNNYFSNISIKEKKAEFRMHALNAPLEMELKIADIKKGALLFNAGIHNWFVVSSTQTDTLSAFRYAAESYRTTYASGGSLTVKETKATVWQPQLYLSPAFEWKGKKASSQVGLYLNYGLRRAYQSTAKDYWWQTGIRYRIFF